MSIMRDISIVAILSAGLHHHQLRVPQEQRKCTYTLVNVVRRPICLVWHSPAVVNEHILCSVEKNSPHYSERAMQEHGMAEIRIKKQTLVRGLTIYVIMFKM